jgi:hypothetical protein
MFDRVWLNAHLATMEGEGLGIIEGGAVASRDGRIAWVGPRAALPGPARETTDCAGAWILPGLIDCHTHLVFGGDRADEFERRLAGEDYAAILKAGGGILSSVRATRAADEDTLLAAALPRARGLMAEGVTTLEVKSGYGLETATELRQLRVARRLGDALPLSVVTTLLAAHAVPPEYAGRRAEYARLVAEEMVPAAVGLADAVDVFHDTLAFDDADAGLGGGDDRPECIGAANLPGDQAVGATADLAAVADALLQLIKPQPKLPWEVAGGAAHTNGASPDGKRPGRVYLHMLGKAPLRASLPDLMCHEGIPGHVMQGDIQARQKGNPKFRSANRYVAYGEGWALYTEALCKEMGAYPDMASDFFRLDAELFRAARLVTDTGIHAKGWTEDQAVDYMIKTGRRPPNQARSEVRRYITLPGQATGYKIGMLKIMELRHKAERELGEKFDLKAYNDLVVGQGSVPLKVLETTVDDWIAARKAGA